jgi:uncharacterized membrane protein YraQ (UPF0718 family)
MPLIQDFITLFLSVLVEATPFLVIGVGVSVIIGSFVSENTIHKVLPSNKYLSHIVIAFLGVLMPVCECGNVPVAKKLLVKGFTLSQSITFLLAAPILNPITIWSTYNAFQSDISVVYFRAIFGLLISVGVGLYLSTIPDNFKFLRPQIQNLLHTNNDGNISEHNHEHCENLECSDESCHTDHYHPQGKFKNILYNFSQEFFSTYKILILGSFFAALSQVFIPREVILSIGQNPVLSIVAMILLSFAISICSNVDAYFAMNYAQTFSRGSLVAFLTFGPMIDMKILTLMGQIFTKKFLFYLSCAIFALSTIAGLIVNLID